MTDMTLSERLRVQYNLTAMDEFEEAADALDAQAERIKALEGALRSLVEWADSPPTSIKVVSAAHDRIVDRAREALK